VIKFSVSDKDYRISKCLKEKPIIKWMILEMPFGIKNNGTVQKFKKNTDLTMQLHPHKTTSR